LTDIPPYIGVQNGFNRKWCLNLELSDIHTTNQQATTLANNVGRLGAKFQEAEAKRKNAGENHSALMQQCLTHSWLLTFRM